MGKIKIFIILFIIFLITSINSYTNATIYYVATNGNNNNPGTEAQPWLTINYAVTQLKAGDTCYVKEGTYHVGNGTGQRYNPKLNPTRSGTAGNPIAIRRYPGHTVVLTQTGAGPVFGTLNRSFIIWDGFEFHEYYGSWTQDTGPVVIWNSDNIIIENCKLEGATQSGSVDNHPGIRVECSRNYTIRNCEIYNFNEFPMHSGAIQLYAQYDGGAQCGVSTTGTIENNYLYNCSFGIWNKDRQYGNVYIRYNYIKNCRYGFTSQGNWVRRDNVHIYQNIFDSCVSAVWPAFGDGNPYNIRVYNNVFYNSSSAAIEYIVGGGGINISVWNNIMYDINGAVNSQWNQSYTVSYWNYNDWYSNATFIGGRNFSSWQTYCSGSLVANCDANSITTNPLFVNPGTDFHLQPSSPCRNAGIDRQDYDGDGNTTERINMGCYINGDEVIGLTTSSFVDTTPPQPPTGLRIIE